MSVLNSENVTSNTSNKFTSPVVPTCDGNMKRRVILINNAELLAETPTFRI